MNRNTMGLTVRISILIMNALQYLSHTAMLVALHYVLSYIFLFIHLKVFVHLKTDLVYYKISLYNYLKVIRYFNGFLTSK